MDQKRFAANDVIFREGDEAGEAYRVASGSVEIAIRTAYGPRPVAQLHAGEIFGEMSLGDDRPRSASAMAIEDTILDVITEENFEQSVLGDRDRLNEYLATLFERLRATDHLLEMATKQRATDGIAGSPSHSMESALVGHLEEGEGKIPAEGVTATSYRVTLESEYEKSGWNADPIHEVIDKFPYRIGRLDPRAPSSPFASNDLRIPDGVPYQVSRNHCAIERHGAEFVLRDRGSTVGTIVNGGEIGVHTHQIAAKLLPGENEIILGAPAGPYHFKLLIEAA